MGTGELLFAPWDPGESLFAARGTGEWLFAPIRPYSPLIAIRCLGCGRMAIRPFAPIISNK